MIDINKNYPVTIINSDEVVAIIAKGDPRRSGYLSSSPP
jgi:hypothetical protein